MRDIGWLRRNSVELAWGAFAAANLAAMIAWPSWETIPFHFVWISLTLVYGFRVWGSRMTWAVLGGVIAATGASILSDAFAGLQLWGELFEVPLMSAMFLAMVWHARRRLVAVEAAEELGEHRARLLERQEELLHDVSHELRTPVTIARGHLDLLVREGGDSAELRVALDELDRIERIIDRLLLLAKSEQPDFVRPVDLLLDPFLADVFLRWSSIAARAWTLDVPAQPIVARADPDALREALDALLENAVKYSEPSAPIVVRARQEFHETRIEVVDAGCGVDEDALERIFERFGRADAARTRALGGVGLGLPIVAAIARAHGGSCTVESSPGGSTFALRLPRSEVEDPAPVVTGVAALAPA
jgi:two-component system, OmpR family, sensor kinase